MSLFANTEIPFLEKMLDVLAVRHRVIAGNVANAQTPGYRSKEVNFQEVLDKMLKIKENTVDPEDYEDQLKQIEPEVYQLSEADLLPGENDVDLEKEMVKLAENTLLYKVYAKLTAKKLEELNIAIKERV